MNAYIEQSAFFHILASFLLFWITSYINPNIFITKCIWTLLLVFFKHYSYVSRFDASNSKYPNNIFIHKLFRCCFCTQRVAEWYSCCDARTAFQFKRIFCTLPRLNWWFNWFFLRSLTCSTRNLPFACILILFSCNYTVFFFMFNKAMETDTCTGIFTFAWSFLRRLECRCNQIDWNVSNWNDQNHKINCINIQISDVFYF